MSSTQLHRLEAWLARTWQRVRALSRLSPLVGDLVLSIITFAILINTTRETPFATRGKIFFVLVLLQTLPLLVRRRWPRAVLMATVIATIGLDVAYSRTLPVGPVIALYTVASACDRRTAIRAGVLTAAAFLAMIPYDTRVIGWLPFCTAAWIIGDNMRTRRAYLHELEERAARLEREQEAEARRAVAEEQARIARELHDVIAHNLGVMVVQAAAADDIFETQPEQAREAIRAVRVTGREALDELRRLLGVVRPDEAARAPQPTLARLDDLISQVRATGLAVELTITGKPHPLPAGIELATYRIVQEALTNILRHAHATRAEIALDYDPDTIAVAIRDNGAGPDGGNGQIGRGLIGMRERATLYGGTVDARPDPAGGFRVNARIPLITPEHS